MIEAQISTRIQHPNAGSAIEGLGDYFPADLMTCGSEIRVRWLKRPADGFKEPFVAQTEKRMIQSALGNVVLETGIEALLQHGRREYPAPGGFIFHVSHCGSTLLSNMLSALPEYCALSEPPVLSPLLDGIGSRIEGAPITVLLRSTFKAIAGAMRGKRGYFIKFTAHHIKRIDEIRQAAPAVPEIFLYRDPLEVLMGNLNSPNQSWVWGESATGLRLSHAIATPVAELFARAIGRMLETMLDRLTDRCLLMNHNEIGSQTGAAMLERFDCPVTAAGLRTMESQLGRNAKNPWQRFAPDGEAKRAAATPYLHDLIGRYAGDAYAKLECARLVRAKAGLTAVAAGI